MKKILDPCCGSKMFWFDKNNSDVIFGDIRQEEHILCDGRALEVSPDVKLDFRELPYEDNRFYHVVFDPPHLIRGGKESWLVKKYGLLTNDWKQDLKKGFDECMRVLKPNGILVFKWNETQVALSEILSLLSHAPLYGHKSGKRMNTHWLVFFKDDLK